MFRKKIPFGPIIPPLFCKSAESGRFFIYLHDSNSIFWARGIDSEWVFGRTVVIFQMLRFLIFFHFLHRTPPALDPLPGTPAPDPPPPDRPKFRAFFSHLRPQFSFFFPSFGLISFNFVGVFEGRNPKMYTFGLSGCRVKPRRPHQTGPPGLAHDSPRTPNVHISGPLRFKHHQISTRRPPERERKRAKMGAGEGQKKREILGPSPSGPHPSSHHAGKNLIVKSREYRGSIVISCDGMSALFKTHESSTFVVKLKNTCACHMHLEPCTICA